MGQRAERRVPGARPRLGGVQAMEVFPYMFSVLLIVLTIHWSRSGTGSKPAERAGNLLRHRELEGAPAEKRERAARAAAPSWRGRRA